MRLPNYLTTPQVKSRNSRPVTAYLAGREQATNEAYKKGVMTASKDRNQILQKKNEDDRKRKKAEFQWKTGLAPVYEALAKDTSLSDEERTAKFSDAKSQYPLVSEVFGDFDVSVKGDQPFIITEQVLTRKNLPEMVDSGQVDPEHANAVLNQMDSQGVDELRFKIESKWDGTGKDKRLVTSSSEQITPESLASSADIVNKQASLVSKLILNGASPEQILESVSQLGAGVGLPLSDKEKDERLNNLKSEVLKKAKTQDERSAFSKWFDKFNSSTASSVGLYSLSNPSTPSFSSMEEAENADLSPGQEVLIDGKKYRFD